MIDMGPLFQTPAEAAKQAVENDVHVFHPRRRPLLPLQRKDAPRITLREFYVLCATLEVPSEALLHPQKLKMFWGPQLTLFINN